MRVWITLAAVLVIAILLWWWLSRPDRASQIAGQMVSPRQAALWQAVSDRGTPDGLERLPVRTVANTSGVPTPSQAVPPAPGVDLPTGVANATRVLATSNRGTWQYTGSAVVDEAVGDRVTVMLADKSTLAFLARVAQKPLGLARGDTVDVTVASTPGVFDRERVLGVHTRSGAVILSALETGPSPVRIEVRLPRTVVTQPPLELIAQQDGAPANGTMRVLLTVNGATESMQPGATIQIGGMTVLLVTSAARPGSAGDDSPYGIELLAWRAPGAVP
jgi:hypothetical protein